MRQDTRCLIPVLNIGAGLANGSEDTTTNLQVRRATIRPRLSSTASWHKVRQYFWEGYWEGNNACYGRKVPMPISRGLC